MLEENVNLRKLRLSIGLKQKELAQVMGLTVQSLSRIENGRRELTNGHRATLKLFLYVAAHDGLVDFMWCLGGGDKPLTEGGQDGLQEV